MREKLIELLGADTCKKECEDCKYCANPEACIEYLKTSMADHLIANGVTMEAYDCHWATETAYKNGYKQGVKDATKWISVKDRLPKRIANKVIVRCENDYIGFGHYEDYKGKQTWYNLESDKPFTDWNYDDDCDSYEVTHWMPLPEPPKEA